MSTDERAPSTKASGTQPEAVVFASLAAEPYQLLLILYGGGRERRRTHPCVLVSGTACFFSYRIRSTSPRVIFCGGGRRAVEPGDARRAPEWGSAPPVPMTEPR
jgi:hypothetical protein